jgi:hypothetical protein
MMARDPLAILARVREAAATDAKRRLAMVIADARETQEALAAHAQGIVREQGNAAGDDVAVFAAWLPAARAHGCELADRVAATEGQVSEARRVLTARRMETKAVGKAIERRDAETAALSARKSQDAMDEFAGSCFLSFRFDDV